MAYQENNQDIKENLESKEMNKTPSEVHEVPEERGIAEFAAQNEDSSGSIKKTKLKNSKRMAVEAGAASAVIGIASFVVIASSGLINVTMNGEINSIEFQDNGIQYNLTVEDVEKDNQLYFAVFDKKTEIARYDIVFEHNETYQGELSGFISIADLNIKEALANKDKLEYDFHLCGDTGLVDRTYDSWTLEVTGFTSEFKNIVHKCDCRYSGNYLFTMNFEDDNGLFTDFTATITDSLGVKRDCVFTSNLHEQQSIPVYDLAGGIGTLEVSFKSDGELVKHSYEIKI